MAFVSMADKLDPLWEGEWVVKYVNSPVSIDSKIMHTNRLRYHYIPDGKDCTTHGTEDDMTSDNACASGIEHVIVCLNQFPLGCRPLD